MLVDKKTQKYDRQLRLWQAEGQLALENSKVCLINGTATGCEIIKDLVLPGIGSFTVVDGKLVDGADAGITFFLDADKIGSSRAQAVTELLQELNEDVKGFHLAEDPVTIIETRPEYFLQFTIVIATEIPENSLLKLAEILWIAKIPLVVVRSVGFIGYFRIIVPEHTVVETHPDNINDLRLDKPFPALQQFADTFDFDSMDPTDHGHIPYVVILLKYLNQWKREHGGNLPRTYSERDEYKSIISRGKRCSDEENFDEALANVWKACMPSRVPREIEEILNDATCENITADSSNFWIIARAIRDFVANEGQGLLPLAGTVPDMKAYTTGYVALQSAYHQQARQDISVIRSRVNDILNSIGRTADSIHDDEIDSFCKNAAHIKVIRYRSLQEEYISDPKKVELEQWLQDPQDNIIHYVLLRAVDRFYATHLHHPDAATFFSEDDSEGLGEAAKSEFESLKAQVHSLLEAWQISNPPEHLDDYIHEICRAGGSELPNIASLIGGLVSQEVIKLITHQYVTVNNTCIFDGVRSVSSTYVL
ncbi:9486_t:CDS:10 [Acaulospora morrowiae]|uniref:NEDD8-activating enzyme E1 regulatory subunit n=1 Tax=Acaulospora morrowiae TaxID=94023 RepID=A0A9N9C101_9GLOM|nr:9486_t:CDS:10 [Acaulospora morrowiae]